MKSVKTTDLHAKYVFLSPPSLPILEKRLRDRGTETEEAIAKVMTSPASNDCFQMINGWNQLLKYFMWGRSSVYVCIIGSRGVLQLGGLVLVL